MRPIVVVGRKDGVVLGVNIEIAVAQRIGPDEAFGASRLLTTSERCEDMRACVGMSSGVPARLRAPRRRQRRARRGRRRRC
jgi:hypothetical protein